jgi:uncharacterized membrane protein
LTVLRSAAAVSHAWLRALKVAQFLSILATGLLAGLLFEFWFFTAPALATLPAPAFIQVTQAIDRQFLVPIPFLYIAVIVTGLIVLLLLLIVRQRTPALLALAAVAVVASVLATVSTLLINVPINVEVINHWSAQNPPAHWAAVRDRWDQANAFRTAMVILAFVCQILVGLIATERRR